MERARRHQRLVSRGSRSGCSRSSPSSSAAAWPTGSTSAATSRRRLPGAQYYPILLAVVKVAVALMLARLAWRFVKARAVARGARRLLAAQGSPVARRSPRVRIELSPRLWLGSFLVTSLIYLVQIDAEGISAGRWPLLAPWLHTSALPVFAVLSVVVALVYRAVESWLSDYESYARDTVARAVALSGRELFPSPRTSVGELVTPRSLFGLAFESQASSRACVGLRTRRPRALCPDLDHGRRTS